VINGTPVLGKGNPRWPIGNAAETKKVPAAVTTASFAGWLADLARRLGNRLFAMNDAEAGWRDWEVTVIAGGLGRQYRDRRFCSLREQFDAHGGRVEQHAKEP
jgi:hypothetical protein